MLSLEKDCFPKCYLKISASRSVPLPQSNRMRGVINGARALSTLRSLRSKRRENVEPGIPPRTRFGCKL